MARDWKLLEGENMKKTFLVIGILVLFISGVAITIDNKNSNAVHANQTSPTIFNLFGGDEYVFILGQGNFFASYNISTKVINQIELPLLNGFVIRGTECSENIYLLTWAGDLIIFNKTAQTFSEVYEMNLTGVLTLSYSNNRLYMATFTGHVIVYCLINKRNALGFIQWAINNPTQIVVHDNFVILKGDNSRLRFFNSGMTNEVHRNDSFFAWSMVGLTIQGDALYFSALQRMYRYCLNTLTVELQVQITPPTWVHQYFIRDRIVFARSHDTLFVFCLDTGEEYKRTNIGDSINSFLVTPDYIFFAVEGELIRIANVLSSNLGPTYPGDNGNTDGVENGDDSNLAWIGWVMLPLFILGVGVCVERGVSAKRKRSYRQEAEESKPDKAPRTKRYTS